MRLRTAVVIGGCLAGVLTGASRATAQTPDGATVFATHCASCHDGREGTRAPAPSQLRARTPESIIAALTGGAMRYQGLGLTGPERRAVAEWLTGRPANGAATDLSVGRCAVRPAWPQPGTASWNGWSPTVANTHAVDQRTAGLTAADLPKLTLKWALGLPDATSAWAQPTVVGGRVFVGGQNGVVYALDAKTGCVAWTFQATGGVRAAVSIGARPRARGAYNAYFSDQLGYAYAVDASDGHLVWRQQVDSHPLIRLTGSPALYGDRLYVPTSSYEEAGKSPTYACCTFRGSLVALDTATGREVWRTYMIPAPPVLMGRRADGGESWGPSGGAIWSAPTIDVARGAIYLGVGNTYSGTVSQPGTDAIVALDLRTGALRWQQQLAPDDVFGCRSGEPNCVPTQGGDFDFGASPVLTRTPQGTSVVVVGQKSGVAFGLDPDAGGRVLWQYRAGRGGALGGIEWGIATDATHAYLPVADTSSPQPGGLHAVSLATGVRDWFAPPPSPLLCGAPARGCTAAQSAAVTVIPGAVLSGAFDGGLRAYSTSTGAELWRYDTNREFRTVNGVRAFGASINGPAPVVVDGMLFVGSGDYRARPGNVLLAFGRD